MNQNARDADNLDFKARFEALLDAAVDAIILIDADGHIIEFNRAAQQLFGYAVADVLGRNVKLLMPEPYRAEHDGYIHRYIKTGEARIIGIGREVVGQRSDGSRFPLELSVGEIRHASFRGFVGIIRDISERKEAEDKLRQQEAELRLVFRNAPTAIATLDLEGRFLVTNRAFSELLGYEDNELVGRPYSELLHPDELAGGVRVLKQLANSGEDELRSECRYLHRSGATVHALLHIGRIDAQKSVPRMFVLELVDRTALVTASREVDSLRDRLAHVGRLNTLGEMAAGIAHELNQPLTAISLYADATRRLLREGSAQGEELLEHLARISEQALRAGEVIKRLRSMLGRQESRRGPVDCNQLIRDLTHLAELDLKQHDFKLRLSLSETLPQVVADPVQLQQVVLNLLRNALDAMRETAVGDEITITTRVLGATVEVAVADSGPGVSAEAAGKIFDPFYTTKSQGLGIGLNICRSIIESHGGDLQFENRRFGGANFHFRLPVMSHAQHP